MYEYRNPLDFTFGTLTNAAAVTDTTLSSADFSTIPSGSTTSQYVPIILLNPATKTHEKAWITAHTSGTSTATVVRGMENTTAQAWPAGTQWISAPTIRDGLSLVPTRSALPSDAHVGMRALIADEKVLVERSLTLGWVPAVRAINLARPTPLIGNTAYFGPTAANTNYVVAQVAIPDPGWPYYIAGSAGFTVANLTGGPFSHNIALAIDQQIIPTDPANTVGMNWVGYWDGGTTGFGNMRVDWTRNQVARTGAHTVYMVVRSGAIGNFGWGPLNTKVEYHCDLQLYPAY